MADDPILTNWCRVSILPLAKDVKDEAAELLDEDPKIREGMKKAVAEGQEWSRSIQRNWPLDPQPVSGVTGKIVDMRLQARLVDTSVEAGDQLEMTADWDTIASERAHNQYLVGLAFRVRIPPSRARTSPASGHDQLYVADYRRSEHRPDGKPAIRCVPHGMPLNDGPYEFLVILFVFDHHHDRFIVLDAKRVRRNVGTPDEGLPLSETDPPASQK